MMPTNSALIKLHHLAQKPPETGLHQDCNRALDAWKEPPIRTRYGTEIASETGVGEGLRQNRLQKHLKSRGLPAAGLLERAQEFRGP